MRNWFFLTVAIVSEVIATSALKQSRGFSQLIPSVIVIVGCGVSFFSLSLTLRTIPVGIAYAVWSGAGVALISIIGWLIFQQKLDVPAVIGISLIVSGVAVLNLFSRSAAH